MGGITYYKRKREGAGGGGFTVRNFFENFVSFNAFVVFKNRKFYNFILISIVKLRHLLN